LELLGFWNCGEAKGGMILNPLSNAQKTGFSEKPVFYSCTHAKRGINNQFLITGFSITGKKPIFVQDGVRQKSNQFKQ
jgi:hypothetical protein